MHLRIRLVVSIALLLLVATTAYAGYSENAYWAWYDGPPADPGSTLVGERHQRCNFAYFWGVETEYEVYVLLSFC